MLKENIRNKIEKVLNDKVVDSHSVSGGCINDSKIIVTKSGKKFFLKTNFKNPTDMFLKEANGLRELTKPNVIRVPEVIYSDNELILLEIIEPGKRRNDFFEDFGRKFAQLHKCNSNDLSLIHISEPTRPY